MICNRQKKTATESNVFRFSNIQNGTLYVPEESINLYSAAYPWYNWGEIKSIDERKPQGGGDNECLSPTITYTDGKLEISSLTPNSKCYYTIKVDDLADDKFTNGHISLQATYYISAYAVAEGYTPSPIAYATLHWLDASFENGSSTHMFASKRAILVSSNGGLVTVSGLNDGERVEVFSADGRELGSTRAAGDAAVFSAKIGEAAILKIGNDSIKAVVK